MVKVQTIWISNSKISDFLKCPRAYFLKNIYKNKNGKKISLINPSLILGQIVHGALESLAELKPEVRFNSSLTEKYESEWNKYKNELEELFISNEQKEEFKKRGHKMISKVMNNPGPLLNKSLRLISPDDLPPRYFLSKDENILLCGRIDWLEYFPDENSVHIIDFKTGLKDENENSLQLLIYYLLVKNIQNVKVKKISYWYIERKDDPCEMPMPNLEEAQNKVLSIALKIKEMIISEAYECSRKGCYACLPLEEIIRGECKFIGTKGYQDLYVSKK